MKTVSSNVRISFDVDYEFNLEKVRRVKLAVDNPERPRLWILYFYGLDETTTERLIRMWFYESEKKRWMELQTLREDFPHIRIE